MHLGTMKQRLGRIPLCIGMLVLVAQNFDMEGRIANGSHGTVKEICYFRDDHGTRYLKSCVVHIENSSSDWMPHLAAHDVPILPDIIDMTFMHPYTKKSCTIKHTQVPIVPAFTMTAHCAQGQTLHHVIINLESCQGTESPYVMVSRATSLEGLLILHPFQMKKITCQQSEDMHNENAQLCMLDLLTLALLQNVSKQAMSS